MFSKLKEVFIGRPLKSSDEGDDGHLLGKLQALAMLSSDALSSIAYGPEQVVLVRVALRGRPRYRQRGPLPVAHRPGVYNPLKDFV